MHAEELLQLLGRREGLKLDFKRELYKINGDDPQTRKRQWDELIKDILALTNGNVGTANQTAHLIIGVGDELRADGSRELFDVGEPKITANQILEKVNAACDPPLPDITCEFAQVNGNKLLIICIPPSPHLHETTRRLETAKTVYSERTVFIRRAEGIVPASYAERQEIWADKRGMITPNPTVRGGAFSSPPIESALSLLLEQSQKEEQNRKRYLAINELPFRKVENFTGRDKEFDDLIKQLQQGETCHIRSFVFGMGGVGKTSLAIQAVHHVKDKNIFPDGIIWYRVRDEDLGRVINRLSQLIFRAQRKENTIAGLPLEDKIEAFQREFRDLKILFVLDNADYDIDRVLRPLLDLFEPFSVLLTSRQELPLTGSAHIITLGGLSTDEAVLLFKRILGDKWHTFGAENEIREVCAAVGYLPLAVKLAAFYVKQNRCPLHEYLTLWRESRGKLSLLAAETLDVEVSRRNVSACFDMSFEQLNGRERDLFLWLGLFQSDFDLKALNATLGEEFFHSQAQEYRDRLSLLRDLLNKLASLSLVDRLEGFGETMRIHLHPLITEFAVEKRGGDVDQDRQIIFGHYLKTLEDDVSIVSTDYVHLKNAINWKFNLAQHREFIDFVYGIKGALWRQGLWKFLGELLQLALRAAQFLNDKTLIARIMGDAGDLQARKGDSEGRALLRQAVEIYETQPEIPESDQSHYLFLKFLLVSDGVTVNERLIRILETLSLFSRYKKGQMAHLLGSFANIYAHLGSLDLARELYLIEAKYWDKGEGIHNLLLSEVAAASCIKSSQEEFVFAMEETVERGLQLATEHRDVPALAKIVLPEQVELLIHRKKYAEADAVLEKLESYAQIMDSDSLLEQCHYLKALLHEAKSDYDSALAYIERANSIRLSYPMREAYLSGLCGDIQRMSYCLDQLKKDWENLGAYARMWLYGLLSFGAVKELEIRKALDYSTSFLAYSEALRDDTAGLVFPEVTKCIAKLGIKSEEVSARKATLFGADEARPRVSRVISFSQTPEPHIFLPKIFSARPLTVSEMMSACEELNMTAPGYYENFSGDASTEPALFLTGRVAQAISAHLGFVLPELDDLPDLQAFASQHLKINDLEPPSDAKWGEATDKIIEWGEFSARARGVIESIIWTTCLTVEARAEIITKLKADKAAALPRAAAYRIEGARLDREFAAKYPYYLINQWRTVTSLLALLGIEEPPPPSVAWGVKSLTKVSAVDEFFLLPLTQSGYGAEPVHPAVGFADCVLLTSKLVDDTLVRHREIYNEHPR